MKSSANFKRQKQKKTTAIGTQKKAQKMREQKKRASGPLSQKSAIESLRDLAWDSQKKSYSPYSEYQVGAAILFESGKMYGGCNIENASYGATVCAERVAVWKALSEGESSKIKLIFVVTSAKDPWPPCGLCRQVLVEFASSGAQVISEGIKGTQHHYLMEELLPQAFLPSDLED